jgi:dienelactone hydrolase
MRISTSRLRAFLLAFPIFFASGGAASAQSPPDAKIFDYDNKIALDVREISAREEDGVIVRDIEFAAYNRADGRVKAYLIAPPGKGKFAGVLFFHWYGAQDGNRNQFLTEAIRLARRGAVSVLIDGRFPWKQAPTDAAADRAHVVAQTIDLRRALDLLRAQPGVDKKRLAFVGHDYGAMFGGNLAGADSRVKNFVLMTPIGSFSDWSLEFWLKGLDESKKTQYRQAMEAVDPIRHVARAKKAKMLFQFAAADRFVTRADARTFYEAAGGEKSLKWYDSKHNLNLEAARADRLAWLAARLNLPAAAQSK